MKQIQISEELFIALMKYHIMGVQEVQPEIEKGLMDKMDSITMRAYYIQNTKQHQRKKKRKKPEKSIWIKGKCRRVSGGRFSLTSNDRSVARTC